MDEDAQARPWTEEEVTRLVWLVDMVRLNNDELHRLTDELALVTARLQKERDLHVAALTDEREETKWLRDEIAKLEHDARKWGGRKRTGGK